MEKKKRPVITKLDNQYIEEKTLENIRHKKRLKFIKRRTMFITILGLVFVAFLVAPLVRNYGEWQESKIEQAEAKETLAALELKQEELEYYVGLLENEDYVLKLARSEYYLTKGDEVVFSFPEDKTPDYADPVNDTEADGSEADQNSSSSSEEE